MAATAQTRITESSRERLVRLAQQTGKSQQDVLDAALQRFERDLFLDRINEGYAVLRNDADAWAAHLAEQESLDAAATDGLD